MVGDLMGEFAIGAAVLGTLSALYFYPYVLLQVPLGAFIDRFGARLLLTSALSIAGIGSILFATADQIGAAYLGRILIGTGSAVGFLGTLAIAGKWFPPHRFAFLAGLVMFFGMMSGVLAQAPLSAFVEVFGWRLAMWSMGGVSFGLALLIFAVVRNAPPGQQITGRGQSWADVWRGLGRALSSREVWKIAIVASTMSGPMLALGGLWGPPYLMRAYGFAPPVAASIVSAILLAWAVGAPFAGWLSDRVGKRKIILVIGSFVLLLAMNILVFLPPPPIFFTALVFVAIGAGGACMAVTFALARENTPADINSSATGIVNSLTVASGAILQPGVGLILDYLWDGTNLNGTPVYSVNDYQTAFTLILVTCAIGFLVSLTLKESNVSSSRS